MKTLIILACILPLFSFAQTESNPVDKKPSYSITAGTGVSYFHYYSSQIKEHFASSEFRLGLGIQKQLAHNFSLQSGLRIGLKLKTPRIYSDQEYSAMPFSLSGLR